MAKKTTNTDNPLNQLKDLAGNIVTSTQNGIQNLKDVESLAQPLLEDETRRLSAKLGADHPQVKKLEAQLAVSKARVADMALEEEVSAILVPEVEKDGVLIHGRIIDEIKRGMGGFQVGLMADGSGSGSENIATAVSEANGYFAFALSAAETARLLESGVSNVRTYIYDTEGQIIKRSPDSVALEKNAKRYGDITMDRIEPDIPSSPGKPGKPKDKFKVTGKITDTDKKPLAGLMVQVFDKDILFDDKLGADLTNDKGKFSITYGIRDFKEGFETGADLYLIVSNKKGETLYNTKKHVRYDAGKEERFNIVIR